MLLQDLVQTSAAVAEAGGRLAKIALLADLLRRLAPEEIEIAIGMLSGEPRQGRIGIGAAALWAAKDIGGADTPRLRLSDVDEAFALIASTRGQARRPRGTSASVISFSAPRAPNRTSSSGCCSANCGKERSKPS